MTKQQDAGKNNPETELDLFKQWVSDVKPLKHNRIQPPRKLAPVSPVIAASRSTQKLEIPAEPLSEIPEWLWQAMPSSYSSYHNTTSHFFSARTPHSIRKQLKQGALPIGATLDLHHHTLKQAEKQLPKFLWHCLQHPIEVALIIHGKGKVLKHWLQYCLPKLAFILGFCEACPRHGEQGAVYVLLKSVLHEGKYT